MKTLALLLVCVVAIAAQNLPDTCNIAERDFCAQNFCSQCRVSNGRFQCTDEPITRANQICASPCHDQQINPPGVELVQPTMHACAYYDMLTTPHTEVLATRCAMVNDESQCEAFAGLAEYQLGAAGTTCGPLDRIDTLPTLPSGSTPCCPNGTSIALIDDEVICISDDPSYAGPALVVEEPICNASVCGVRTVSVLPGVGIVRSGNESASDVCASCAFKEVGDPCGDCGVDCFELFPVAPPTMIPISNVTVVPGVCGGGVCVGAINASLVGANLLNEPCQAGYCRTRLRNTVLEFIDVTNPALWPTPTCNPLCPGYPNCAFDCPGWPNIQDSFGFLEPEVSLAGLTDGKRCRQPTSCVLDSVCVSGVCTSVETREPVCEQATCRLCAFQNGTCSGGFAPVGTRCKFGCLVNDTGTCDGAGNCVGTLQDDSVCEATLLSVNTPISTEPKDQPCFDFTCQSNIPPNLDFQTFIGYVPTIFLQDREPLTSQTLVDELVDLVFPGFFTGQLSTCAIVAANESLPCDDGSLCTIGEICINQVCTAQQEVDSYCQWSQCQECNPATGLCDGPVSPLKSCFSGCGSSPNQRIGVCDANAVCVPSFLDNSLCGLTGVAALCNVGVCTAGFSGTTSIPIPINTVFPVAPLEPDFTFACSTRQRANGTICSTAAGMADACIVTERCQSGTCEIATGVDCSSVVSSNVCADVNATVCNPMDGSCTPVGLPNGTPCDTGDVCFVNATCFTPPMMGGIPSTPVCSGVPALNCSSELENSCAVSSVCRASLFTGEPECFTSFLPNGVACAIPNPGLCVPNGQCLAGVCVPQAIDCPPSPVQCMLPSCDPMTGNCGLQNAPDATTCDDSLKCTLNDVCTGGVCSGVLNDCLPAPAECLDVVGCSEADPGDGCTYSTSADGTMCLSGLGLCQSGICEIVCTPPCQNGGDCVLDLSNTPVCDCPSGFSGPTCETESGPPPPPSFVPEDVRRFGTQVFWYAILFLLAAAMISLILALLCTCCGTDYEPDIRIYQKRGDPPPQ